MNWAGSFPGGLRFPRRGGNYNNGGNIGLGYENCNNPRSNANMNYGVRPRSQHIKRAARLRIRSHPLAWEGYVSHPDGESRLANKNPSGKTAGIAVKRPDGRKAMAAGSV